MTMTEEPRTVAPPQAPEPAPCEPWCTDPSHREPNWDAVSGILDGAVLEGNRTCTAIIGRPVALPDHSADTGGHDTIEVALNRYQCFTAGRDKAARTTLQPTYVTLNDQDYLDPAAAREVGHRLITAADLAEGSTPAQPAAVGCPAWCTAHRDAWHRSAPAVVALSTGRAKVGIEQFAPTAEQRRTDGYDGVAEPSPVTLFLDGLPHPTGCHQAEDLTIADALLLAQTVTEVCGLALRHSGDRP